MDRLYRIESVFVSAVKEEAHGTPATEYHRTTDLDHGGRVVPARQHGNAPVYVLGAGGAILADYSDFDRAGDYFRTAFPAGSACDSSPVGRAGGRGDLGRLCTGRRNLAFRGRHHRR